jgi:UDP-sugar transporter A1/2/3
LECGGLLAAVRAIGADLRERPAEWAQLAVPALLYTVQNTMMYVGYANVEAAVGQITYQSKILWTALFSVLILGKRLSVNQWLSLAVLALGVIAVQGMESKPKPHAGQARRHRHAGPEQNPLLGVGALVLAALCTSFASVYFERMLKGASKPSLWLRNIQLAVYCTAIAAIGVQFFGDESIGRLGWLHGFDSFSTWLCIAWQAMGGILVAVTIKYADNILRGFAQGLALIIGAIGSYFLFDFPITPLFTGGAALVMIAVRAPPARPRSPAHACLPTRPPRRNDPARAAEPARAARAQVFMYGSSAQNPQELCEALCGMMPKVTPVALAEQDPESLAATKTVRCGRSSPGAQPALRTRADLAIAHPHTVITLACCTVACAVAGHVRK